MLKKLLKTAFIPALLAAFVSCSFSESQALISSAENSQEETLLADFDDSKESLSSVDMAHSLRYGWNLGNTLDAYSDKPLGLDTETCWGMPRTTKEMIGKVKNAGFYSIRIPVSWHNHVNSKNKIDKKWMARVKQIVDWALEAKLYVIINIHHDNLTPEQVKSGKAGFCLSLDSNLQSKSISYLTTVWSQVAETFKDYDHNLIFEIMNEPRRVDESTEWGFPNQKESKIWNDMIKNYEQQCLKVIRESGSKNSDRFVMCPEYAASPYFLDYYSLPEDSAKDRLVLATHAYDPYDFCMNKGSNNKFTSNVESSVNYLFKMLAEKYTSKGIGVVMGETSASDKNNLADRIKWTKCYYGNANKAKISVILWDNNVTVAKGGDIDSGECHGYFDRNNLSWYFPDILSAIRESYGR